MGTPHAASHDPSLTDTQYLDDEVNCLLKMLQTSTRHARSTYFRSHYSVLPVPCACALDPPSPPKDCLGECLQYPRATKTPHFNGS